MPPDDSSSALQWMSQLLMVLGVVALGVLFIISARARARRDSEEPSIHEAIAHLRSAGRASDDATAQEAQLLDTAQRLAAQMEARIGAVEQLLEEADLKIAELQRLTASAGPPRAAPASAAAPLTGPAAAGPAPTATHPLASEIYTLADQGHDAIAIARQLGEQTGKVQLILALRRHTMAP